MIVAVILAVALIVALAACGALKTQADVDDEEGVTPEDIDGSAKDSTTVTKEDIDSAADAINNRKSGGNSNTGSNGVDPENKGTDSDNTDNDGQNEQNENDSSNGLFNAIMDIVEGGETHDGEKFAEGITNTITEVANGVARIIGLEP